MTLITVIDTETTGTDPAVDRVIEAARVVVDAERGTLLLEPDYSASYRFHPGERGVPPEASAVHHITLADLDGRPPFTRGEWGHHVAPSDFMSSGACAYLAAHNAAFDRSFVDAAPVHPRQYDPGPEVRPWLCTMKLARVAWPEAPAHGNQVLRYWLGLTPDLTNATHAHAALYDAIVTAHLLVRLLQHERFGGDLAAMAKVSAEPSLLRAIGFGKHHGLPWAEAPQDYLRWVLRSDFGPDEHHTARHYLRGTA